MTTTAPTPSTTDLTAAPLATAAPVRTLGVISLVLGVASLAFGLFFVVPVAAIVLGAMALKSEPDSRAIAIGGIVTGAVSLSGFLLVSLGFLAFLPFFGLASAFGWN